MTIPDIASARAALDRARAEQGPASIAWLERARRLSQDDPAIVFLLASAIIATEPDRARAMLLALLDDHPGFRDAAVALAASEWRAGRAAEAAARLGALLRDAAAPPGAAFRRLADAVCRAVDAPGWIGVDGAGRIELSASGAVRLELDGAALTPRPRRLPARWRQAAYLDGATGHGPLLGTPVDLRTRRRSEGFVDIAPDGTLAGWAWLPADPDHAVTLRLLLDGVARSIVADDTTLSAASTHGADQRRGFRVPADILRGAEEIRVIGPDGRDLAGSPLHPGREAAAARAAAAGLAAGVPATPDPWRPLDVGLLAYAVASPRRVAGRRRDIDIVIPVWRGAADLAACLATLRGRLPPRARIVVVDDATTDPQLLALLDTRRAQGEILVLRHAANRGFPAAANTGLRHAEGRDVLLLNPDTLLPPVAVARLARAAYAAPDIGSVTPITNDGTILSYAPAVGIVDAEAVRALDRLVQRANGSGLTTIPTAIGFCMYVRHDCLRMTGLFRDEVFAQGYGEENDWSLRARHLGWRHVAATGLFVAHLGGRSFGAVKTDLIARNLRRLNRLHPGYDAAIGAFIAADPLAPARRRIDARRWATGRMRRGGVALISHAQGGGVARFVAARSAAIRAEGKRAILLAPFAGGVAVGEGFPDLHFALPAEFDALVALLAGEGIRHIELHHFIGHRLDPAALAARLAVPLDIYIHDSAAWCPRVTLTDATRYCGEPTDIDICRACVRDLGSRLATAADAEAPDGTLSVAALRDRSRRWLRAARRVVVACDDAARRIARQFPPTASVPAIVPVIAPWEDDAALVRDLPGTAPAGLRMRIVVVGAIGPEKGFQVLLDCARDAARRDLRLDFVLVGYSCDDARLLETGRVFVTGRFDEGEAPGLVMAQGGQFGFIPSVWPETWCYALSALWQGGLRVACFALGAQAERVARSAAGAVLPLGLPIPRLNDLLLELAAARR